MNTRAARLAGLMLALSLAGPGAALGSETFDTCTGFISSVPTVISTQGTWCMDKDLATGIGSGHAIIVFDGNTFIGLQVNGAGSMIRRNRVNDTGGSTATLGFPIGIHALGSLDVLDNTVFGVVPTADGEGNAEAEGIRVSSSLGAGVSGNRVRGVLSTGLSTSRAINTTLSERNDVRGNFLVGPGDIGINCGLDDVAEGNHVTGFDTALNACAAYPNFVVN